MGNGMRGRDQRGNGIRGEIRGRDQRERSEGEIRGGDQRGDGIRGRDQRGGQRGVQRGRWGPITMYRDFQSSRQTADEIIVELKR